MEKNKHIGSTLDSFLEEEGILEHTEKVAKERIVNSAFAERFGNL